MNVEVAQRTITEARLEAAELAALTGARRTAGPRVVLQAEGLGSPRQWTSQLPTAADRIVVQFTSTGRRFERAWVLSAQTAGTRYYTLERDSSGSGYISR